ncbi:MAG TPA: hypothetical protein DD979_00195 [Gammaproteobacteria bacterium]|nr:hypothetical protein [Gammaproteobacteria bacterium]
MMGPDLQVQQAQTDAQEPTAEQIEAFQSAMGMSVVSRGSSVMAGMKSAFTIANEEEPSPFVDSDTAIWIKEQEAEQEAERVSEE